MKRWVLWLVLTLVALAGLALSFGVAWCTGDWTGLFLNLGTELVGAVGIYILLERFIGGREKHEEEKARLIVELGCKVNWPARETPPGRGQR